jgi:hypothetical protein
MVRCEVWARQQARVVHEETTVVHAPSEVVHAEPDASAAPAETKHGKYADPEKRKAYRREWMKAKRAAASGK